ncbi:GNAT family N-acetyltransferase, partial [Stenotrophomonas maltophilia]|uniref:GNAT family N-acetyltransferase n=1 Tax=Stenotrophomonas maltophilia TaxID=40324 RepID=UPI001F554646
ADSLPARVRILRASDAAAWSHYLSLPGVIEHTSWGDVSEQALAQQITRYLADASDQRWALVDADDQLIGTVGLNGIDPRHGRGELAYDLDPRWQGQGLATHAARGVAERLSPCAGTAPRLLDVCPYRRRCVIPLKFECDAQQGFK